METTTTLRDALRAARAAGRAWAEREFEALVDEAVNEQAKEATWTSPERQLWIDEHTAAQGSRRLNVNVNVKK